jgi:predicted RNA-binding protein associated with RNAse of E/G family
MKMDKLTAIQHSNYSPGDVIVLREIWDGKIWTARPVILVQDDAELIALHIPEGTHWKHHQSRHGDRITALDRKNKQWVLRDFIWENRSSYIKLAIPGESYSVRLFRNPDYSLHCWYINLEDAENPMHRTLIGFDCTDQILDVITEPNLKDWHWDDEDELREATEVGLISTEKARLLYSKGEKVRDLIMSGKSVFNGW